MNEAPLFLSEQIKRYRDIEKLVFTGLEVGFTELETSIAVLKGLYYYNTRGGGSSKTTLDYETTTNSNSTQTTKFFPNLFPVVRRTITNNPNNEILNKYFKTSIEGRNWIENFKRERKEVAEASAAKQTQKSQIGCIIRLVILMLVGFFLASTAAPIVIIVPILLGLSLLLLVNWL